MTLGGLIARHIDTRGRVWRFYDPPQNPIAPPEGFKWVPANQETPKFSNRSDILVKKQLDRVLAKENRERDKRDKEFQERYLKLEKERYVWEPPKTEYKPHYNPPRKTKLTCVETSRAVMVANRLKSHGWERVSVGTWKNKSKSNLYKIRFLSHETNQHKFFIEAHFK